ncbi:MAG: pirin family protein [Bacteroidota bacterium]|nr:pirin family protein [Bacteroidota bacterium]
MATTLVHKANTRGHADHGWLNAYHSFSFASYYNPERMHYGVLRVLNDDTVAGGMGFGKHPHDNMEIITIVFEGELKHQDSMGNSSVIKAGDIQVMSAGTGIQHSEINNLHDKPVRLLQIWLFPIKQNVTPRYQQISLNKTDRKNKLQQVLSPNETDEGVWIHQNAWFYLSELESGNEVKHTVKLPSNGVYIFVLFGKITVNGETLERRDAIGIRDTDIVTIKAEENSEFLVMDLPMN